MLIPESDAVYPPMADEHLSLTPSAPPPPTEADYDAIAAAVMETVRGRWFLAEFAKRNRNADTEQILKGLDRIETLLREQAPASPGERVRIDLVEMAGAIARTRTEIAAIRPDGDAKGTLSEASEELDSIVQTTERATSDILAATEQVQEIAWTLREGGADTETCDALDRRANEIYSACSFQDLTGQRTRKVVDVLHFLEDRIRAMIEVWVGVPEMDAPAAAVAPRVGDDRTIPHLEQREIDRMMPSARADAPSAEAKPNGHDVAPYDRAGEGRTVAASAASGPALIVAEAATVTAAVVGATALALDPAPVEVAREPEPALEPRREPEPTPEPDPEPLAEPEPSSAPEVQAEAEAAPQPVLQAEPLTEASLTAEGAAAPSEPSSDPAAVLKRILAIIRAPNEPLLEAIPTDATPNAAVPTPAEAAALQVDAGEAAQAEAVATPAAEVVGPPPPPPAAVPAEPVAPPEAEPAQAAIADAAPVADTAPLVGAATAAEVAPAAEAAFAPDAVLATETTDVVAHVSNPEVLPDATTVEHAATDGATTELHQPAEGRAPPALVDEPAAEDPMPFSGPLSVDDAVNEMLRRASARAEPPTASEPGVAETTEPVETAAPDRPFVLEIPEFTVAATPAPAAQAAPVPEPPAPRALAEQSSSPAATEPTSVISATTAAAPASVRAPEAAPAPPTAATPSPTPVAPDRRAEIAAPVAPAPPQTVASAMVTAATPVTPELSPAMRAEAAPSPAPEPQPIVSATLAEPPAAAPPPPTGALEIAPQQPTPEPAPVATAAPAPRAGLAEPEHEAIAAALARAAAALAPLAGTFEVAHAEPAPEPTRGPEAAAAPSVEPAEPEPQVVVVRTDTAPAAAAPSPVGAVEISSAPPVDAPSEPVAAAAPEASPEPPVVTTSKPPPPAAAAAVTPAALPGDIADARPPRHEALAAIAALSDDEKIALFS